MPLRTRFVLYFTLLVISLMFIVIGMVERRLRGTFLKESKKRGVSITRSLAAASIPNLITYNYIALKQNAEKAGQEDDIVYIVILDKEGRIAAFSGYDHQKTEILADDVDNSAEYTSDILVKEVFLGKKVGRVMDIRLSIFIEGSTDRWGLIRVGISLEQMYRDIASTRFIITLLGLAAVFGGWLGSFLLSRRITKPLERLVHASIAVAKGDLDQSIDVSTGDEIEELANNFNHMTREVISHRRELEAKFREISALKIYNDNVLKSMSNGLLTLNLDGEIVTINSRGEDILGYRDSQVIGRRFEDAFGEAGEVSYLVKEGIEENKIFRNVEVSFSKREEKVVLLLNISFLSDSDGSRIGVLVLFDDITELKTLQEKIKHADRLAALGTVAATIAHEVKNPLSVVKTFVQLLPRKGENEAFRNRFNVTVSKELNRMNDIIENFLDLARKPKLRFSSLDVNRLIRELVEMHTPEMDDKNITVRVKLSSEIMPVSGDQEYLKRAFSNLILNAIQAMFEGGDLHIMTMSITDDGEGSSPVGRKAVKIVFRDTGIGMDPETVKNLFNPFYSTKSRGTGLGLVIVEKIIEEHKGVIRIKSEFKKGSTFTVILPTLFNTQS
ncbi:MAG: ATP-binding protein [Thermodesulfobacteriota bacterium]